MAVPKSKNSLRNKRNSKNLFDIFDKKKKIIYNNYYIKEKLSNKIKPLIHNYHKII